MFSAGVDPEPEAPFDLSGFVYRPSFSSPAFPFCGFPVDAHTRLQATHMSDPSLGLSESKILDSSSDALRTSQADSGTCNWAWGQAALRNGKDYTSCPGGPESSHQQGTAWFP